MKHLSLLILIAFSCSQIEEVTPEMQETGFEYYQLTQYDFDGKSEQFPVMLAKEGQNSTSNGRIASGNYSTVQDGSLYDSETWGGSAPSLEESNVTIEITHKVFGNYLLLDNNVNIHIRNGGYLELDSLTIKNSANINVDDGGILIVRHDLLGKNNINMSVNGIVAVGGDIDVKGGVANNNSDKFYVCGNIYDMGVNSHVEKTCADLEADHPELYEVINNKSLPITLLYQKVTKYPDHTLIEFETVSEQNSHFVTVSYSTDGKVWEVLDTLHSNNEPSYYSLIIEK